RDHFRAFQLTPSPSKEVALIELAELADTYPLADYMVGGIRMRMMQEDVSSSQECRLLFEIKTFFGLDDVEFRIQYMEVDFDNQYVNLTSTSEIKDKKRGSTTGFEGWKQSLKYKMANFCSRLGNLGCPEICVNALKSQDQDKAALDVKKPKKAEINREFMRITTVPLTSKCLSQLDEWSDQLVKVFINKGGAAGKEIWSTIAVMEKSDDIEVRQECILKCLCTYLHEDSGKLVGEYL
ncbi:hypothetical protein KUCAC02_032897, partial [Chaenocephalus aceratus]